MSTLLSTLAIRIRHIQGTDQTQSTKTFLLYVAHALTSYFKCQSEQSQEAASPVFATLYLQMIINCGQARSDISLDIGP